MHLRCRPAARHSPRIGRCLPKSRLSGRTPRRRRPFLRKAHLLWGVVFVAAAGIGQGWVRARAGQQAPTATSANSEWRTYGGNLASFRYAPLDQINKDNFNKLEIAWRLK